MRRSRSSVGARRAGANARGRVAFFGWLAARVWTLAPAEAAGLAARGGFTAAGLRDAARAERRLVVAARLLAAGRAAGFFAVAFLAMAVFAAFLAAFLATLRVLRGAGFEPRRRACFFVLAIAQKLTCGGHGMERRSLRSWPLKTSAAVSSSGERRPLRVRLS